MNKLTKDNYADIYDSIITILNDIIKMDDKNILERIGKNIFEIGSINKFWSELYATLYKDLIKDYAIMKDICISNFKSFEGVFKEINYIEASENYNLFCDYNKQNEKRRALSSFFTVCAKLEIIDIKDILHIIENFIKQIKEEITLENKKEIIGEIVENLYIMILKGKSSLRNCEKFSSIKEEINNLSELNYKKYPSLTQKVLFKFMDIVDELDD